VTPTRPGRTGLTFLVVEDDASVRRLLTRGLAEHGEVDAVATLAAGRLAFGGRTYDAMILDVALPDGSGLDLIEAARARCPGIYVLVVTGRSDHAVIDRALEIGGGFLLKPFEPKHFAIVAEAARARRMAAERRTKATLERWAADHGLSSTEVELLALGAEGVPRREFAERRRVRPDTIRKQIQTILQKTGDETFDAAVRNVLREALSEPT
jgi:two-component system chemotaxis response regulator CheY